MYSKKRHTVTLQLLVICLVVLSVGAFAGGLSMVISPDGSEMGIPLSLLEDTPFDSFLIPGIVLMSLLGLWPAFTLYGLLSNARLFGKKSLQPYPAQHWSWTSAYSNGVVLILWINIQLLLGISFHILHFVYDLLGLLILILVHLPKTKAACKLPST